MFLSWRSLGDVFAVLGCTLGYVRFCTTVIVVLTPCSCVCVCVCVYAGYIPQELLDVLKNLGEGVPDNLLDQLKQVAEPDDEQQVNIRHLVDILLKTAV